MKTTIIAKLTILLGAALLLLACGPGAPPTPVPTPTPIEVARQWVDLESAEGQPLRELGGEWLEAQIRENLSWTYGSSADGADYDVVVTAATEFEVDDGPVTGPVKGAVPFGLRVRGSQVLSETILVGQGSVAFDLTGIDFRLDGDSLREGLKDKLGK